MHFPELSLFVFYFLLGSYEGFVFAVAFMILMFKLKKESDNYYLLVLLTFCGFTLLGLLEAKLFPYLKEGVIYVLGPMADWVRGVNDLEIVLTGTISTALFTVILGLKKLD